MNGGSGQTIMMNGKRFYLEIGLRGIVSKKRKEGLVEIKEFIAEEDAFTWYPPSWIPDEGVDK
jgi:hypothetical protein